MGGEQSDFKIETNKISGNVVHGQCAAEVAENNSDIIWTYGTLVTLIESSQSTRQGESAFFIKLAVFLVLLDGGVFTWDECS